MIGGRRQTTLSAFFAPTPRPAPVPPPAPPPVDAVSCAGSSDSSPQQQLPARKRLRKAAAIASSDSGHSDDNGDSGRVAGLHESPAKRVGKSAPTIDAFRYKSSEPLDLDPSSATERQKTRRRFLARFTMADNDPKKQSFHDSHAMDIDSCNECDDEDDRKRLATPKKSMSGKIKYTPLEQQYLDIRKMHPGVVLAVEVGYKFRFFEEDALIASKELNIVAYMDKNLRGASIPTHRLNVHVSKLVHLGYKVGIVRQTETAALKAAGDNRSAPFTRKLTNIFTKGTFIDADLSLQEESRENYGPTASFILVLNESSTKKSANSETVQISFVAVQLSTGDVVYDTFEDNSARSDLETRLEHLGPVELILPLESLSSPTEKLLSHWAERNEIKTGGAVRIERLKAAFVDFSKAQSNLMEFYERPLKRAKSASARDIELYTKVLELPSAILVCFSALLTHLSEFGLDHVLLLTKSFSPFASVGNMILSGTTLKALEVFEAEGTTFESSGKSHKGSLMWVIDHTVTKFGARLLKRWVSKPLVNVDLLNERVDAVEEVIAGLKEELIPLVKMRGLLHQLPAKLISEYLLTLDGEACGKNLKHDIFVFSSGDDDLSDALTKVYKLKEELRECQAQFADILVDIRKKLKGGSRVDFVSVSGTDYLIEVKSANVSSVPKNWICVAKLKAVSRFHTPEVLEQIRVRDILLEKLTAAADVAYLEFLANVANEYHSLRDVVQSLAIMDCLFSLAKVADLPGYTKPVYTDDPILDVKGARHPMVEILIPDFVPNDISLTNTDRCLLITGPNMGGKSSYIRQVALIALLGQIGSYVPAESARVGIFDAIYTRMGAYDDITRGQSTFMKELSETSGILRSATTRSLVIVDELGRGTSTHDGTAIAYACLCEFVVGIKCATLFVTHYPLLGNERIGDAEHSARVGGVRCAYMGFIANGDDQGEDGNSNVTFLYKLTEGLAARSYGLNVARLAGIPAEVVKCAQVQSKRMETLHELAQGMKLLKRCFG
ncbi:Mismatch repair protein msh3 [Entophlyctis luteolus]|nr:Mismatch repair protein msh3 [Entophlyctis luteolus]